MSSVLGVSVGAGAVRLARLEDDDVAYRITPVYRSQSVVPGREPPEDLAAESIGVLVAGGVDSVPVRGTAVACRDAAQASAIRAAMERQHLGNYQLVSQTDAVLELLESSELLGEHATLLLYDLGSSGLTVSIVDRQSGVVEATARTEAVSGKVFDRLIRDNQLASKRIAEPVDAAASLALDARCREAKERLSNRGAVAVAGEGGLLLLSRDVLDSLIGVTVESSARFVREVIAESGRVPDAVVLTGGGARIPLVQSVIASWIGLPLVVPEHPELVVAQGAALMAQETAVSEPLDIVTPPTRMPTRIQSSTPSWLAVAAPRPSQRVAKPQIRGAALVGGALAVVVVIGLGLGYGGNLLSRTEGSSQPMTLEPAAPPPILTEVATSSPPPPAPPSPIQEVIIEEPEPTVARIQVTMPETAPPPPPPPLFPGLPQIQLPQIQLPQVQLPQVQLPLPLPTLPRLPGT